MDNKKLTRRKLIQNVSTLLVSSAISPALLGQKTPIDQNEVKTVFIPPGGGPKGQNFKIRHHL